MDLFSKKTWDLLYPIIVVLSYEAFKGLVGPLLQPTATELGERLKVRILRRNTDISDDDLKRRAESLAQEIDRFYEDMRKDEPRPLHHMRDGGNGLDEYDRKAARHSHLMKRRYREKFTQEISVLLDEFDKRGVELENWTKNQLIAPTTGTFEIQGCADELRRMASELNVN